MNKPCIFKTFKNALCEHGSLSRWVERVQSCAVLLLLLLQSSRRVESKSVTSAECVYMEHSVETSSLCLCLCLCLCWNCLLSVTGSVGSSPLLQVVRARLVRVVGGCRCRCGRRRAASPSGSGSAEPSGSARESFVECLSTDWCRLCRPTSMSVCVREQRHSLAATVPASSRGSPMRVASSQGREPASSLPGSLRQQTQIHESWKH